MASGEMWGGAKAHGMNFSVYLGKPGNNFEYKTLKDFNAAKKRFNTEFGESIVGMQDDSNFAAEILVRKGFFESIKLGDLRTIDLGKTRTLFRRFLEARINSGFTENLFTFMDFERGNDIEKIEDWQLGIFAAFLFKVKQKKIDAYIFRKAQKSLKK